MKAKVKELTARKRFRDEPLLKLSALNAVLGPDHPSTKEVRENYTNLLQKMGQKTEAADQED